MSSNSRSLLLKCLKCRLIGRPPVFDLAPPPAPPKDILEMFLSEHDASMPNDLIEQIKQRRCLNNHKSIETINDSLRANKNPKQFDITNDFVFSTSNMFNLNQLLIVACLLLFLFVLVVAIVFLVKLFRIKKQLKKCKEIQQQENDIKCLSSSLTSSTTSSNSNTSGSQHLMTPSTTCSMLMFDSNNMMTSIDMNKYLIKQQQHQLSQPFYNQLFESSRLNFISNTGEYLQAVPNSSNLIENKILKQLSEYDEINSQIYNDYNQYELSNGSNGVVSTSTSCSSSNSTAPLLMFNNKAKIVQPICMPTFNNLIENQHNRSSFIFFQPLIHQQQQQQLAHYLQPNQQFQELIQLQQ